MIGAPFRAERFDATNLCEGDASERVPDVEGQRTGREIRGWAVEPGDAVVFDFRTMHGAPADRSDQRRRVIRCAGSARMRASPHGRGAPRRLVQI